LERDTIGAKISELVALKRLEPDKDGKAAGRKQVGQVVGAAPSIRDYDSSNSADRSSPESPKRAPATPTL
jgi:hypothetical protein